VDRLAPGGDARRLTSHVGDEIFPKFSPDGRWIAFTGEYDGNPDVYVVSAEGGEPKRPHLSSFERPSVGWTPDGKDILFRADRTGGPPQSTTKLYLSAAKAPTRELPPRARTSPAFARRQQDRLHRNAQESAPGKSIAAAGACRSPIYDLKKTRRRMPKSTGMDLFPMWHGNAIYFISDRDGVMNLYSYDLQLQANHKAYRLQGIRY